MPKTKKEVSSQVSTVPVFQLYNVHKEVEQLIETMINPETGEVNAVVNAHLNTLTLKREDAIHQIAIANIANKAKSEMIAAEIKRLQTLKKQVENRSETAKRILENELTPGEVFEFNNVKISWRKSSQVKVDEFIDVADLAINYPDLVKIEYSLDKTKVKEFAKDSIPLPEGISIEEKQNIQIK